MTDSVTTDATTTPVKPIKPGWRTSEFYGSWAVKILGALVASGVLGDGTTAMRIAGAAMTILGFFGYTYSRTLVKTAAALMLYFVVVGQVSCTPTEKAKVLAAGHALWDCLAPERAEAVDALTPFATSVIQAAASADGKLVDASKIRAATSKAHLSTEAGVLIQCAMATAFAALIATPQTSTAGASSLSISAEALRDAWSQVAPAGARFKTAYGEQ